MPAGDILEVGATRFAGIFEAIFGSQRIKDTHCKSAPPSISIEHSPGRSCWAGITAAYREGPAWPGLIASLRLGWVGRKKKPPRGAGSQSPDALTVVSGAYLPTPGICGQAYDPEAEECQGGGLGDGRAGAGARREGDVV
jgi:hypothetical protein